MEVKLIPKRIRETARESPIEVLAEVARLYGVKSSELM